MMAADMCPRGVLLVCVLVGASAACDEAAPFASPSNPDAGEGEAGSGGGGGSYRVGNGGGENTGSDRDAATEATGDGGADGADGATDHDADAFGTSGDAGGVGPSCARPAGSYQVTLPGDASNELNFCTTAHTEVFDWGTWFDCMAWSETYSDAGCSAELKFACFDTGNATLQCTLDAKGKGLDCDLELGNGCSGVVRLDSVVCPTSLDLPPDYCCAPGETWTGGKCQ